MPIVYLAGCIYADLRLAKTEFPPQFYSTYKNLNWCLLSVFKSDLKTETRYRFFRYAFLKAVIHDQPTANPPLLRLLWRGMDQELMPGLLVAMAETQKLPEGSPDFYNGPNIAEVTRCIPILQSLSERLQELRSQWPDHVTLNEVTSVMNKTSE